jgi:hypothetical protein
MNDENNRLESLIDHALESYTSRAARPGLDQRILASVVAASRPRGPAWRWRPVWALAAAAALLAMIAIPVRYKLARPTVAMVHAPDVVVEKRPVQTAPALVSNAQHTSAVHLRPVARDLAETKTIAQTRTGIFAPLTIETIQMKPITIAPIQIDALN